MIIGTLCSDDTYQTPAKAEDMNEDLKQWLEEHKPEIEKKEEDSSSIYGKCERCEFRDAKYKCIKCEKLFCLSCFWTMIGMCKDCMTEEQMKEYHF